MNFEKLKAFFMPLALGALGWAVTPAGQAALAPFPWAVPVVTILAGVFHAGDTLTDKTDWRQ